jgi:hypothetical protein
MITFILTHKFLVGLGIPLILIFIGWMLTLPSKEILYPFVFISWISAFFSLALYWPIYDELYEKDFLTRPRYEEFEVGKIISLENTTSTSSSGQISGSILGFSGGYNSQNTREYVFFSDNRGITKFHSLPAEKVYFRFKDDIKEYKIYRFNTYYTDFRGNDLHYPHLDQYIIEIKKEDINRYITIDLKNFK